ncbi:uncharacterized protein IWZ02DRAFT_253491 [Phyllosticta citriasiana]|uniref:uncharacterized protein n=1 Tax=Phyllosticta citriasiana TaxID=595635 RepID=UPI0030FD4D0E
MHSDIPIWFALGFLWASTKSTPLRQLPMNTLPLLSLLYRIWSTASISTPFETSFTINLVQQVAPRAGYLDVGQHPYPSYDQCRLRNDIVQARMDARTRGTDSTSQLASPVSKPVQSDIRRLHHLSDPSKQTRRAASTAAGEHSARLELTLVRIPRDAPSTRSFASDYFHPCRPSQSRQIRAIVQLLIVRIVVSSQVGDEKSKARK